MTNQVDTSTETIDREWMRIALEHKAQPPEPLPEPTPETTAPNQNADVTGLDFEGVEGVEVDGDHLPAQPEGGATIEEKIAIAETVINGGLVFVVDALAGIDVPDEKYQRVAHAWAVVIANRFEGGIFDFLARYKNELAAAGSSLVFIKAVREGYNVKKARIEQEQIARAGDRQAASEVNHAD